MSWSRLGAQAQGSLLSYLASARKVVACRQGGVAGLPIFERDIGDQFTRHTATRPLYVSSSSDSRPILEWLGFIPISAITTFSWSPSNAASGQSG